MRVFRWPVLLLCAVAANARPIQIAEISRSERVDFGREIYPLLKHNCLACHNATKAKADLNLESPALMRKGGESGPAVVPGKSGESLLLKSAAHVDDDLIMPPPGNKVKAQDLTSSDLALLKLWIDQGAQGEAIETKSALTWRSVPARGPINAVAITPDGRLAAAACGRSVALCELLTGRVLNELGDPAVGNSGDTKTVPLADQDAVMSVGFASDELLATGGFRSVRLWRRMPRVIRKDVGTLAEPPTTLAVSADGKTAAAGDAKGSVWIWAMEADKFEPVQLKEHSAPITALVFSPDNTALISAADDKRVVLWALHDRSVALKGEVPAAIHGFAFLDGGAEILAAGADGVARVWTWLHDAPAELPPVVREFKLQDGRLGGVALAGGGTIVWAATDGSLRVSDANDGKEQRTIPLEPEMARRVALLERELQAAQALAKTRKSQTSAGADELKKECERARTTGQALEKARSDLRQKKEEADAAADSQRANPGDKALQEATKKAVDAATKSETAFRAAKVNAELAMRLAGDAAGRHARAEAALASAEAAVSEAQAALDASKKRSAEASPAMRQIFAATDGVTVIMTAADERLRHASLESGALLEPPERAGWIAPLPDGNILSAGPDKRVRITSARRVWTLERTIGDADNPALLADRVTTLAFSPDGKLLATGGGIPSRDGELKLWDVTSGALVRDVPKAHSDTINAVSFSPDGELLATGASDRLVRIWRVADGSRVTNLEGHSGHVLSVAWRADGLALVSGGADRTVRVWDLSANKQVKSTSNFGGEVSAVAFVGAGELILAASGDKTVRLGDQQLPDVAGYPFCATSDMTGRLVTAGAHDGVLRVWNVSDRKIVRTFNAASR